MGSFNARTIAIELMIMCAIGLTLGLIGLFGSGAMPMGWRLLYWIGFIVAGYALFRPLGVVALWLSQESRMPYSAAMVIASLLSAFPLTWLIGFAIGGMRYDDRILGDGFALLYVQCASIGIAIFLLMRFLFGPREGPKECAQDLPSRELPTQLSSRAPEATPTEQTPTSWPRTPLHDRLPPGFPARIVALGMDDHYVHVHGLDDAGGRHDEMLLMRLGDAARDLDGIDGATVHRSWWVARDAVRRAERDGRRMTLELEGGLEVPVSRSNMHAASALVPK